MIKIEVIDGVLYQWDIGRKIKITTDEEISEVHFSFFNDKEALVVEPKEADGIITADIPNILLQSGEPIVTYISICSDEDERTITYRHLHVNERPKPTDYVYTETECLTVKDFVDKALMEAKESGDFKGDKGDKGDAGSVEFKVVDELPTEDISESVMYLVPIVNDDDSNNYLEYIYVDGRWECIDTIQFDGNLDDYVKKTDYAASNKAGLVVVHGTYGAAVTAQGMLYLMQPSIQEIDAKSSGYKPITPHVLDYAVMSALTNPLKHEWTEEEKASALSMLGVDELIANLQEQIDALKG